MSELKLQQCRLDGRYDILECLGRGSYAEVYLARDEAAPAGSPQTVVIKALNIFLQGSIDLELERTLIENFRNEAIALDRVRHPNVINRLGHGTAIDLNGQTFHYLVLEYLSGGTMADMCRHSPLPIDRALFYLDQVSSGLQHAHDRGVIHRDIKPQNLLLTSDRQVVKIADFGVAKLEASEGGITRVGTDVYAAPEHHPLLHTGPLDPHASSAPARILTPAADVYSLAKTAYMLLTGEAPRRFSQKPITELPAPYASQPWGSFVTRVLRRATEPDPTGRHQSVRDFWGELRDALMPKTQLLSQGSEETRALSQPPTARGPAALPPEPLPASFEPGGPRERPEPRPGGDGQQQRPRIVVPVTDARGAERPAAHEARPAQVQPRGEARAGERGGLPSAPPADPPARPAQRGARRDARAARDAREERPARRLFFSDPALRWIVPLLLLLGFAVLLLGVHYSVRSRQRAPQAGAQQQATAPSPAGSTLQAGREMITTTYVNLREGPIRGGRLAARIGVVENGSRVRILQVSGNWVEVEVIQRGLPNASDGGPDRGWIDGTKLR
jgi:serine/threonine protein kinase